MYAIRSYYELLREMGVAVCETPRYEADDILGTFARKCESEGIDALLVTGDRDALQLISERRITSYNVCYTKLLRIVSLMPFFVMSTCVRSLMSCSASRSPVTSSASMPSDSHFLANVRITSYNVCYTKLLRPMCAARSLHRSMR